MFIDGIIGLVSGCMLAKSILIHNRIEAFIWGVVCMYGLINYTERKLRGGKYDY